MKWLYEECFPGGTTVVQLTEKASGCKIGQLAMVHQTVWVNGTPEKAAQLVDLFLLKEWRNLERMRMLFDEVGRQFAKRGIRFAFGMPNVQAMPINERFFKLKAFLSLDIKLGFALPFRSKSVHIHEAFHKHQAEHFISIFNRFATEHSETGLRWDGESLYDRLCGYKYKYAIHATDSLLLISSPRISRGIPYTLAAAYLCAPGSTFEKKDMSAVTRAACAFWKRPIFIYAGFNRAIPTPPGIRLPERYRPSPMLLQMRDFVPERGKLDLDRFQLIDFDFA